MRVTNRQSAEIITNDLYRNYQLLLEKQIRLSSQKNINKPSDDPIGMSKILDYREILSSIEQYNRNINQGKVHLEITETSLDEIDTLLKEAKEIALKHGAGDQNDNGERDADIEQLKNIYDQLMAVSNTKLGNNYIFAGRDTDDAPFSRDTNYVATYDGETGPNGDISVLTGDNVSVKINASGQDVFDPGGTNDIFDIMHDLLVEMGDANLTPPGTYNQANVFAQVARLDGAIGQVQNAATETAVYYGRLESAENYLTQYQFNIENMLSETEDLNLEQAIVELQLQETAYLTCLETASRIIQRSLVDYIT